MSRRLIDIHNHSLCCVDDGAKNREESVAMLRDAGQQGIEAVVFTPHYRHGMFSYNKEEIEKQYHQLVELTEELGINLYIGCEYHVNSDMIHAFQTGRCHTLADSDYVLTEYSYKTEYSYMAQHTQQLLSCGYIPVIAHVERYECIQKKPMLCEELADMGAWIQVNADSILGKDGFLVKQVCKKLLKKGCVDVIASDAHNMKDRPNNMGRCYDYVVKKYGEGYADRLFYHNPRRIIEDAKVKIIKETERNVSCRKNTQMMK